VLSIANVRSPAASLRIGLARHSKHYLPPIPFDVSLFGDKDLECRQKSAQSACYRYR
jgi:hypothetical protein